jgi:hypothetical protein
MSEDLSSIQRADILKIVSDLHFRIPTEEEFQYVFENFDAEAERDSAGDWQLWIENLLVEQDIPQSPPPPKFQYFLFDQTTGEVELDLGMLTHSEADNYESNSLRAITERQLMVEQALQIIQKDIRDGDLTAIECLLQVIPKKCLKDFLPEF